MDSIGVTSLTFDLNGGNVGDEPADVEVSDHIGDLILSSPDKPTPVRTGYTLKGWAYDDAGAEMIDANDLITDDLTVYAIWLQNRTITFNLQGGNVGEKQLT